MRGRSVDPAAWRVLWTRSGGLLVILILMMCQGSWQPVWAGDADGGFRVAGRADRLTVSATGAPLAAILQDIARRNDLTVHIEPSVADDPVTAAFDDLSLQDGLEKILAGYNYAFTFSARLQGGPTTNRRVTEVWVLSEDDGSSEDRRSVAVEESPRPAPRAEAEVHSPDPFVRLRAVDALRERGDPSAVPILMSFLNDQDQVVRLAALDVLNNLGVAVPAERIAEIAINHEDPQIRLQAVTSGLPVPNHALVHHALHDQAPSVRVESLQALEGDPRGEAVAREALRDPDPAVRSMANELLNVLKEGSVSDPPRIGDEDDARLNEE